LPIAKGNRIRFGETLHQQGIRNGTRGNVVRYVLGVDPMTGKRANVGVVRPTGTAAYVRTYADGLLNDNLLAMNQCSI
jgi:hypothetical protein